MSKILHIDPAEIAAYDKYHARYNFDMKRTLTALFEEFMPADDAQVSAKLLVDACLDHARYGGRIRHSAEIELRRLILYHLKGGEGDVARRNLSVYLARFD